jgi:hypothetical protein
MNIVKRNNNSISIFVDADIINTSSSIFDLELLKQSLISQLTKIYQNQYGKFNLVISIKIDVLTKVSQCTRTKTLFQIVDSVSGNNPEAMQLTEQQIELLIINYKAGLLNKNFHLKGYLWWKKLV